MFTAKNVATKSQVPIEADQYEQIIALSQGGALQTATAAGRVFSVANQAAAATTSALATTWKGLGVCNPAASGKNLIIHEFGWGMAVVGSGAGAIGLMTADTTGFTSQVITIRNALDGSALASVAYTEDDVGIGTPILRRIYGDYGTEDTATALNTAGPHLIDLAGGFVIPPGRTVLTYTTVATTATFVFHFVWEEVPE